jgi:exopolysaccharide biosynthesis protein
MTSLLTIEMKELKRTFKKNKSKKKIGSLNEKSKQESKQIEEKSFVPISWSITDPTTKDLLPTNKRITGEL